MDGVSQKSKEWGDALLHPHRSKHGKAPRFAGQKEEPRILRAEPSHGVSTHSNKSNEHSRKYGKYPRGKKVHAGGDDHEG